MLEFPPLTPSTDQVTDVFADPVTVAANCVAAPAAIFAEVGLRATITVGLELEEVPPHPTKLSASANTENWRQNFDKAKLTRDPYPGGYESWAKEGR